MASISKGQTSKTQRNCAARAAWHRTPGAFLLFLQASMLKLVLGREILSRGEIKLGARVCALVRSKLTLWEDY